MRKFIEIKIKYISWEIGVANKYIEIWTKQSPLMEKTTESWRN
jgi:hypothetical protein